MKVLIPTEDLKTVYYTYDSMNRLEYIIYQDGSRIKYEYNAVGDIKKVTDQREILPSTNMTALEGWNTYLIRQNQMKRFNTYTPPSLTPMK